MTFYWSFLAFIVGVAAGFQGIYERYGKDAFRGARTGSGILYLVSRGAIPSGIFCALLTKGAFDSNTWLWALGCGTGAEVLLRSKFYIKQDGANQEQDVLLGPLDLLKWWQNMFLSSVGTSLSAIQIRRVRELTPHSPFLPEIKRIKEQLLGITDQTKAGQLRQEIDIIEQEYHAHPQPDEYHYNLQLYFLLHRQLPTTEFHAVITAS